jgi:hypothetical protein
VGQIIPVCPTIPPDIPVRPHPESQNTAQNAFKIFAGFFKSVFQLEKYFQSLFCPKPLDGAIPPHVPHDDFESLTAARMG